MYRKFDDDFSTIRLKIGDEIPWTYGYRVYESAGKSSPAVNDYGEGSIKLVDSTLATDGASGMLTSLGLTVAALSTLFSF